MDGWRSSWVLHACAHSCFLAIASQSCNHKYGSHKRTVASRDRSAKPTAKERTLLNWPTPAVRMSVGQEKFCGASWPRPSKPQGRLSLFLGALIMIPVLFREGVRVESFQVKTDGEVKFGGLGGRADSLSCESFGLLRYYYQQLTRFTVIYRWSFQRHQREQGREG